MNITDKQFLAAAGTVTDACNERKCAHCPLGDENANCTINGHSPDNWGVPSIPAEPEPTEPSEPHLCKLFGVGVGERFDVLWGDGLVWIGEVWAKREGDKWRAEI